MKGPARQCLCSIQLRVCRPCCHFCNRGAERVGGDARHPPGVIKDWDQGPRSSLLESEVPGGPRWGGYLYPVIS